MIQDVRFQLRDLDTPLCSGELAEPIWRAGSWDNGTESCEKLSHMHYMATGTSPQTARDRTRLNRPLTIGYS